jgi:hypothetical protein
MSIISPLESEDGFTIQELLVAIVAGSLLVGFSFSLYLFVGRIVQKDTRGREHRENTLRTVELITSDIEQSSCVVELTDSSLALESAGKRRKPYSVKQGVLFRGAMAIGPAEGEQWRLLIRWLSQRRIEVKLKNCWAKDSSEAHAEVAVPVSSAVMFYEKVRARGDESPVRNALQ